MEPGFYCRSLSDHLVVNELHLRPSYYSTISNTSLQVEKKRKGSRIPIEMNSIDDVMRNISMSAGPGNTHGNNHEQPAHYVHDLLKTTANEIKSREKVGEFTSNPASIRKQLLVESEWYDPRPHAVCTVQVRCSSIFAYIFLSLYA